MKKPFFKWTLRLTAVAILLIGLLVGIVLQPTLLYANKTINGNFTIYHESPLDSEFKARVNEATEVLKNSEIYDPNFKMDICLNDGSPYPALVQFLHSPAFGIGFYNKVIIMGSIYAKENYDEIRGYKWNLTQLLCHEVIHCLQYNRYGLWNSNPFANYPNWKWEGYNEYISRQNLDQKDLSINIKRLNDAIKHDKNVWGITFVDGTIAARDYYNWWILTQYCMDIKKMSYDSILKDTISEETLRTQMMNWYDKQN